MSEILLEKVVSVTSEEAAAINAARVALQAIEKRCRDAEWGILNAGKSARAWEDPAPGSYGFVSGHAHVADYILFEVLNAAHAYTHCLTSDEIHNRPPKEEE